MENFGESKSSGISKRQIVTPRLAGFLFWANVLAVILLLVGFATPGWLTATTRQVMHDYNGDQTYDLTYQDYSLWYVTQCTWVREKPYGSSCDTRSYRLLEYLDERRNAEWIEVTFVGRVELYFAGAGLVFSQLAVRWFQVLSTLSVVFSLILLSTMHSLRENVTKGRNGVQLKTKILWVVLAILAAVFTFIPVAMFANVRGKLHQPAQEFGNLVKDPFGIVFAGIGGALMLVLVASIVICHFVDCSQGQNDRSDPSLERGERLNETRDKATEDSQQTPM